MLEFRHLVPYAEALRNIGLVARFRLEDLGTIRLTYHALMPIFLLDTKETGHGEAESRSN